MQAPDLTLTRTADDLIAGRDQVVITAAMAPQQPDRLLAALLSAARRRQVTVQLMVADVTGRLGFLDSDSERQLRDGSLRIVVLAGTVPRRLSGLVDWLPLSLSEIDRRLADGSLACDIFAVRVAAASDGDGFDLGYAVGYTPTLLSRSDTDLAVEVAVDGRECTRGLYPVDPDLWRRARLWHDQQLPSDPDRATPVIARASAEQIAIARNVAGLIPERATLQVGIGGLADQVVRALGTKPQLGIHTGTLPAALQAELLRGGFRGTSKTIDTGLVVATSVAPNASGATWPESVRLRPLGETHAASVLEHHESLWAVNSCFSVDLIGQVNATSVGGCRLASGGGQADFTRAAHTSADGASVIAIAARSSRGVSRIVTGFEPGAEVTTGCNDVDFVVTEFGVAELSGRTCSERIEALIGIAHPDDRAMLLRATEGGSAKAGGYQQIFS